MAAKSLIASESQVSVAQSSIIGFLRAVLGIPIEHPLETIKTRWQSKVRFRRLPSILGYMYSQRGLAGFYAGLLPNTAMLGLKQLYRWPMLFFLPQAISRLNFHSQLSQPLDAVTVKCLTGLAIAAVEVAVICPVERIKVWQMTQPRQGRDITKFIALSRGRLLSELYRGKGVYLLKQAVSWVSFLGTDEYLKIKARLYRRSEHLSLVDMSCIGLVVGVVSTILTLPMDCIKTQYQMKNRSSVSVFEVCRRILGREGVRGFYVGWVVKLCQQSIDSIVTLNGVEYLRSRGC